MYFYAFDLIELCLCDFPRGHGFGAVFGEVFAGGDLVVEVVVEFPGAGEMEHVSLSPMM